MCPATVAAVMAEGKSVGSTLYVCTDKQCKIRRPRFTISPEEREQLRKQPEAIRIQREFRRRLLSDIYKHVPAELTRHELELVALGYFQQPGHDSQHRLFKFFTSDKAKDKAVKGGYADYPKLASAKVEKMTTSEIGDLRGRLLVLPLLSPSTL